MKSAPSRERILGLDFLNASAAEAVRLTKSGGLLVAPSGTCFERFAEDSEYRRAVLGADVVLPDSGLLVLLWRLLYGREIKRVSGLAYLKELLGSAKLVQSTFWVLPNERALEKLLTWSKANGIQVDITDCYLAPIYGLTVIDEKLRALIESRQTQDVIIGIGAGSQEKLGWYLREQLSYHPAIHCIGGALGFVTGDQVAIPDWADRFYLGWLLRLSRNPRIFIPRLFKARWLPWLLLKYGRELPPLREGRGK